MKRKRMIGVALVLLGMVGAGVFFVTWATASRHGITHENAGRLHVGMHRSQVEEVLGGSPGNYSGNDALALYGFKLLNGKEWIGDDCAVLVWFDTDERVTRFEVVNVVHRGGILQRWFRWATNRY